jgi:hypothetical protein
MSFKFGDGPMSFKFGDGPMSFKTPNVLFHNAFLL